MYARTSEVSGQAVRNMHACVKFHLTPQLGGEGISSLPTPGVSLGCILLICHASGLLALRVR